MSISPLQKIFFLTLVFAAFPSRSAEPPVTAADLPRVPATEPSKASATLHIKKGFHVDLVASEPEIASPVAVAFDERGRMYVVEMIDYSERRDHIPHLGCIRMLEDTNGDGVYDKSTLFADNLPWPTGVFCWDGGIFVIANPDILYLKDTKATGTADVREVVFTGFSEGVARVNVQEMPNSLIWGLDNRIHGATSGNGGSVRALRHPEAGRLDLKGRDFVIEPRSMSITAEAGGGQHGLSFDNFGRRFTCNNSDHIRLFMYDERYAGRNRFYSMPPALTSIAVEGPAAEVYRISQEEPWRVVRTRWRIAGVMPGPVEGGGRSSGYFTGATGITIYRGNAFPAEFQGDAFIGECAFNLVHRKKLYPDGVGLKAQRAADETNVEFLASTDNWFRPVQFANAPDGTLYLIDMYREIVEHPWSLPDSIKKFLDLNSGSNRGRIYRIAPDGFKEPPAPRLDRASTAELVALLEHPNGWHRDTAARLLYERQDKGAVPLLREVLHNSKSNLGRLHALHALDGLGALDEAQVLASLSDPDEHVREHAIVLSEKFFRNGTPPDPLWAALQKLTSDPSVTVRYQLAFTLGELDHAGRVPALEQILRQDVTSPWIQAAVLSSVANSEGEMFSDLAESGTFSSSESGRDFLAQLIKMIGARNSAAEIDSAAHKIDSISDPVLTFALLRALGEGLQRNGTSLDRFPPQSEVGKVLDRAQNASANAATAEPERIESIRLLGFTSFNRASAALLPLLRRDEAEPIQSAAVAALAHFAEPSLAREWTRRWSELQPEVRTEVIAALMTRPERILVLLHAIKSGSIPSSALTISQVKALRNHRNTDIRALALQVLGTGDARPRQQIVEAFLPALGLTGDPAHGKDVYLERCATCHRLGGNGFAVGPDLVTVKSTGKEKILTNILDPNREVAPNYIAFEIETRDGESATGVIANETTSTLTLRQAGGKSDVINRTDIRHMRSLGQSIMPEGLEQGLKPQDFADLLQYITTAGQ